jgi:hypothetical protein
MDYAANIFSIDPDEVVAKGHLTALVYRCSVHGKWRIGLDGQMRSYAEGLDQKPTF